AERGLALSRLLRPCAQDRQRQESRRGDDGGALTHGDPFYQTLLEVLDFTSSLFPHPSSLIPVAFFLIISCPQSTTAAADASSSGGRAARRSLSGSNSPRSTWWRCRPECRPARSSSAAACLR